MRNGWPVQDADTSRAVGPCASGSATGDRRRTAVAWCVCGLWNPESGGLVSARRGVSPASSAPETAFYLH